MARRADGSSDGVPFEEDDLSDPELAYGGRQFFFPDASRIFADIDRTIGGRDERGEGSTLDRKAEFDFIRALPSGGYTRRGEVAGRDFFPYKTLCHRTDEASPQRPRHRRQQRAARPEFG